MCGILGMLAFGNMPDKKSEKIRQETMIFMSSELLQLTQPRGKDATGISTLFSNCDYMGLKMGIPPTDFISRFGGTEKDFDGYLNIWRKKSSPAKMVIGHCRKSSVGNAEDNVNNHPIKVGDVIGVHNGTLTNHDKIFELLKCKRDGKVDSEAIFRLLHHFTNNGEEPFSPKAIQEVCKRLHGSYSCLSFSGNNPYQMVGFRDARPMETLLIKPLKLLLIASDKDFLKHVVFRYNKIANLYQTATTKFPPLKKSDVELESLRDDTLFIFDIRKEIEDKTKIEDLVVSEKIPRIDKIWGELSSKTTGYTPRYSRQTYSGYNEQRNSTDKNNSNKSTLNSPNESKDRLGMAWNKESNSYKDIINIVTSRTHKNVEIDSKNGEVIDSGTKKILVEGKKEDAVSKFELTSSDKNIDNLITSPAKINEPDPPSKDVTVIENKNESKNTLNTLIGPDKTKGDKTEVVLKTYPEVLEKAGIALRKEDNFSNINEVRLALDIDKTEDLRRLPLYSLANRIKRFFYKKGWYNGYVSCLEDDTTNNGVTKERLLHVNNKRKSAEKNIRIIKNIVHIFDRITTDYEVDETTINKAVTSEVSNNDELNVDLIKSVFKSGDFKKAPTLEKITTAIMNSKNDT